MKEITQNQACQSSPLGGNEGGRIEVYGAREHNLKNIDATIPHGSLTVITGLSGSPFRQCR